MSGITRNGGNSSGRYTLIGLLIVGLSGVVGCGQRDEIARYTVTKPEIVDPTLASSASDTTTSSPQQTVGLIVPVGDVSWFFKLTGPQEAIEPQHEAFLRFVQSVKFSGEGELKPTWQLPAGWQELPGSQFRYATIRLAASGDKPLDISVSSAGGNVLDNVNRWRNQLNLKPIDAAELKATTKTMEIGGREGTLVSLVGSGSGGMQGAPTTPLAGGRSLPADHPPVGSPGKDSAGSRLRYDAPAEWTPAPQNAFSVAAFQIVEGSERADVTVSTAGGDLPSNVNRWRGQIGLGPMSAAEMAKAANKIEAFGASGDYVKLVGPETNGKGQTILGVRVDAGGGTWFVKLKGDSKLAAREKGRFEAFVRSLQLPERR